MNVLFQTKGIDQQGKPPRVAGWCLHPFKGSVQQEGKAKRLEGGRQEEIESSDLPWNEEGRRIPITFITYCRESKQAGN